jgi:uncharacterized membrane protein YgcG
MSNDDQKTLAVLGLGALVVLWFARRGPTSGLDAPSAPYKGGGGRSGGGGASGTW